MVSAVADQCCSFDWVPTTGASALCVCVCVCAELTDVGLQLTHIHFTPT